MLQISTCFGGNDNVVEWLIIEIMNDNLLSTWKFHNHDHQNIRKQAGAELGQAQPQLGLRLGNVKI